MIPNTLFFALKTCESWMTNLNIVNWFSLIKGADQKTASKVPNLLLWMKQNVGCTKVQCYFIALGTISFVLCEDFPLKQFFIVLNCGPILIYKVSHNFDSWIILAHHQTPHTRLQVIFWQTYHMSVADDQVLFIALMLLLWWIFAHIVGCV